jgi:hypothetical protein
MIQVQTVNIQHQNRQYTFGGSGIIVLAMLDHSNSNENTARLSPGWSRDEIIRHGELFPESLNIFGSNAPRRVSVSNRFGDVYHCKISRFLDFNN